MDTQAAYTQRVLWGVVAVSLLVIVVLAGGLYFLRPQGNEKRIVVDKRVDRATFDPLAYVRNSKETPGLIETTQPVHQIDLVVGEARPSEIVPAVRAMEDEVVESPENPVSGAYTVTESTAPVAAIQTSSASDHSVSQDQSEDSEVGGVANRLDPHWIQVGSFSSQARANELRNLVDKLGYSGGVSIYTADGTTMYRVRVGPYSSREEAGHVLGNLRSENDLDGWIARTSG